MDLETVRTSCELHERLEPRRHRRQIAQAIEYQVLLVSQQTEAGTWKDRQYLVLDPVFAIAEECEVAVRKPAQEGGDFGSLGGAHRRAGDVLRDPLSLGLHQLVVDHRRPDIGEHRFEIVGNRPTGRLVDHSGDLDLHHRLPRTVPALGHKAQELAGWRALHGQDGMNHEIDHEIPRVQRQGDAVHQKRHVVIYDLHYGPAGAPSMAVLLWVEHAQLRPPGTAFLQQLPQRGSRVQQIILAAGQQILRGHVPIQCPDEAAIGLARGARGDPGDRINQGQLVAFRVRTHKNLPFAHSAGLKPPAPHLSAYWPRLWTWRRERSQRRQGPALPERTGQKGSAQRLPAGFFCKSGSRVYRSG